MNKPEKKVVIDSEYIRRAIMRIAHEICERNNGTKEIVLLGIITRGDILAQRIAEQIEKIEGTKSPVGALNITFHRDDTNLKKNWKSTSEPTHLPFDLNNKKVVLVDDVLYTGRSIRAAIDEIIDYGRPKCIQLAVLIDRGHRELPIAADFIGKRIDTEYSQKIEVLLKEKDSQDEVLIS